MVAFTPRSAALAWAVLGADRAAVPTRAPRVWAVIAVVALLVSFGGPFSGTGVSDENRLVLALMHVVAAAVVIPLLYRSSRGPPAGADVRT